MRVLEYEDSGLCYDWCVRETATDAYNRRSSSRVKISEKGKIVRGHERTTHDVKISKMTNSIPDSFSGWHMSMPTQKTHLSHRMFIPTSLAGLPPLYLLTRKGGKL